MLQAVKCMEDAGHRPIRVPRIDPGKRKRLEKTKPLVMPHVQAAAMHAKTCDVPAALLPSVSLIHCLEPCASQIDKSLYKKKMNKMEKNTGGAPIYIARAE